jgi:4-hydroxy-4-methyl-2-oxoglutarate aldolase
MNQVHQVNASFERPPTALVERFKAIKTEILATLVPRSQFVDGAIRPLFGRDWRVVGPALTVSTPHGDSLMCFAAVAVARPGDVIVVAAGNEPVEAPWGGGLTWSAKNRGAEGVVVDGLIVDSPSILGRGVPVFCRGSTLKYRPPSFPGSVNIPVTFGGVAVSPGDLVFGDLDCLLILPKADLHDLIVEAEAKAVQIAGFGHRLETEKCTLLDMRGGKSMVTDVGVVWND